MNNNELGDEIMRRWRMMEFNGDHTRGKTTRPRPRTFSFAELISLPATTLVARGVGFAKEICDLKSNVTQSTDFATPTSPVPTTLKQPDP
jgi:hypothetical protein